MISFFYRCPDLYCTRFQSCYRICGWIVFPLKRTSIQIIGDIALWIKNLQIHGFPPKIISPDRLSCQIIFFIQQTTCRLPIRQIGRPLSITVDLDHFVCVILKACDHFYGTALLIVNLAFNKLQTLQHIIQPVILNTCLIPICRKPRNIGSGVGSCFHTFLGIIKIFLYIHGYYLRNVLRFATDLRHILPAFHLHGIPRHNRTTIKVIFSCNCFCCIYLARGTFCTYEIPCSCRNLGQHHCCCRCSQSHCQPV